MLLFVRWRFCERDVCTIDLLGLGGLYIFLVASQGPSLAVFPPNFHFCRTCVDGIYRLFPGALGSRVAGAVGKEVYPRVLSFYFLACLLGIDRIL